jgi:hypothetical protein
VSTSAFSRDKRPLMAVAVLAALGGLLALAGSAGAAKPGWYNYPSINTGPTTVGATLTGGTGALQCDPLCKEDGPNPEYSGIFFQWLSCNGVHGGGRAAPPGGLQDEGGPCPGATIIRSKSKAAGANNYTIQASDAGRWIQMEIIAVNYDCSYPRSDGWQECRYSEAHAWTQSVGPVAAPGPPPPPPPPPVPVAIGPTYTALPAITGEPEEMQTLTVSNGTWNGTQPLTYTYQWLQCSKKNSGCKPIDGATQSMYTVTPADVATRLTASVTVKNGGGTFTAAAKLTPKIAGAKPRPGNDALDVGQLLPRHRLKVQTVTWTPRRLRPGGSWIAKVTVVDARGFLIKGVQVTIADQLGDVTSRPTLTNARGVATMRLRTTRFVPLGRLVLTVAAAKPESADALETTLTTTKRVVVTVNR